MYPWRCLELPQRYKIVCLEERYEKWFLPVAGVKETEKLSVSRHEEGTR